MHNCCCCRVSTFCKCPCARSAVHRCLNTCCTVQVCIPQISRGPAFTGAACPVDCTRRVCRSGACGLQAAGGVSGTTWCVSHCYLWVFMWGVALVKCWAGPSGIRWLYADYTWHCLPLQGCHTTYRQCRSCTAVGHVGCLSGPARQVRCVRFCVAKRALLLFAAADIACQRLCLYQSFAQDNQRSCLLASLQRTAADVGGATLPCFPT